MAISITIPEIGGKGTVKDAVISILSSEWPLTTKKIYNRVRANGHQVSYQAVHKTLKELLSQQVIIKQEQYYQLNTDWIRNLKEHISEIETNYEVKRTVTINTLEAMTEQETHNLIFNSPIEMGRFIFDVFSKCPNPNKKPVICQFYHTWSILALSDADYRKLQNLLAENECYILSKHGTFLDKLSSHAFEKLGGKVKHGVDVPMFPDTIVVGDYLAYIYFPQQFIEGWDNICRTFLSLASLNMYKIYGIVFGKYEIHVTIVKNQKIADRIRDSALRHFGEKNDTNSKHTTN